MGVHGVGSLLRPWGMTDALMASCAHESTIVSAPPLRQYAPVCANQTGWIEFPVRPGLAIEAGQPVAYIRDILGRVADTVVAPHSGYVIELAD